MNLALTAHKWLTFGCLLLCSHFFFAQSPTDQLFQAVHDKDTLALKEVLFTNIDLDHRDDNLFQVLHYAARDGFERGVEILLENGADIEAKVYLKKEGAFTPLMFAAYNNEGFIVHSLLSAGADIDFTNEKGFSAYSIATEKQHFWILELLKDPVKGWQKIQAFVAVKTGKTAGIEKWLANGGHVNVKGEGDWYLMHYAAINGDTMLVDFLLDNNANPDVQKADGWTPMMLAAFNNKFAVLQRLINANADVTKKTVDGQTVSDVALINNNDQIIRLLIDYDGAVKQYNLNLQLNRAARTGDLDLLEKAIDLGAQVNAYDDIYFTPLAYAVNHNKYQAVEKLIENGADVNQPYNYPNNRFSCLMLAAYHGHELSVKELIDAGADTAILSKDSLTAINIAQDQGHHWIPEIIRDPHKFYLWQLFTVIENGYHEELKEMVLANNPDIYDQDPQGLSPLQFAVQKEEPQWVQVLLDLYKENDTKESRLIISSAHQTASTKGNEYLLMFFENYDLALLHHEMFESYSPDSTSLVPFLEKGANIFMPNELGFTLLHLAVIRGWDDQVAHLIQLGADTHKRVKSTQMTPLMLAAYMNNLGAFLLLLEAGADKKAKTDKGATALDFAHETNATWILKFYENPVRTTSQFHKLQGLWKSVAEADSFRVNTAIKNGVDINEHDGNGLTALHMAAQNGSIQIIRQLVYSGANINARDIKKGRTPLMLAARNVYPNACRELVELGADPFLKDNDSLDFSDHALNKPAMWDYLLEFHKNLNKRLTQEMFNLHAAVGNLGELKAMAYDLPSVTVLDTAGWTPLHYAVFYGHEDVTQWLLYKGANPDQPLFGSLKTPLMLAAIKGDFMLAQLLLSSGANSSKQDANGKTAGVLAYENNYKKLAAYLQGDSLLIKEFALIEAVLDKDIYTTRQLLAEGVNSSCREDDSLGFTPLHYAARDGYLEIVQLLLIHDALVNIPAETKNGQFTPLMLATYNDFFLIADTLIEAGADINWENKNGLSARSLAKEKSPLINLLIKNREKSYKSYRKKRALIDAVRANNLPKASQLLKDNSDPNQQDKHGWSPIHYAATYNNPEMCEILLAHNAKINIQDNAGWTPIMVAMKQNAELVFKCLIQNNADTALLTKNDSTLREIGQTRNRVQLLGMLDGKEDIILYPEWFKAINNNDSIRFMELLKQGLDVNYQGDNGYTAMHFAASSGDVNIVKHLVNAGADISITTTEGWSPIMYAAANNNWEITYLLIQWGAEIDLENNKDMDAREIALSNNYPFISELIDNPDSIYINLKMIKSLIANNHETFLEMVRRGSNIHFQNQNGWQALHYAVREGNESAVKILLNKKADVNFPSTDEEGNAFSPLMIAAYNGQMKIARMLIEAGADINYTNEKGEDAFSIAKSQYHFWMEHYLENTESGFRDFELNQQLNEAIDADNVIDAQKAYLAGASIKNPIIFNIPPLHYAVRDGKYAIAEWLLRYDVDVNEQINLSDGWYSPLMIAAYNDNIQMAMLLYNKGADIEFISKDGRTALDVAPENTVTASFLRGASAFLLNYQLFEAVKGNDTVSIITLIKKGADPDFTFAGHTLLYNAAYNRNYEALETLIKIGANLDMQTDKGETALMEIVRNARPSYRDRNFETTCYLYFHSLVAAGANTGLENKEGSSVTELANTVPLDWFKKYLADPKNSMTIYRQSIELLLSLENHNLDAAATSLEKGADINFYDCKGMTLLQYMLTIGHYNEAKWLLENGALQNAIEFTDSDLEIALTSGREDLFNLMAEKGFKPDLRWGKYSRTELFSAVSKNKISWVKKYLEIGADINARSGFNGVTPLGEAVRNGFLNLAEYLLNNGANPNIPDSNGATPLLTASEQGLDDLVALLLKYGADPNVIGYIDRIVLHEAVKGNNQAITKHLLEHGADPNAGNKEGLTALHIAARENNPVITGYLLDHGAYPNLLWTTNGGSYTPLMVAASNTHLEIVKRLVDAGADLAFKNREGQDVYAVAREMKNKMITQYFVDPVQTWKDYQLVQAIKDGSYKTVDSLLKVGAKVVYNKNWNDAPMHQAVLTKDTLLISRLIKYGTNINAKTDDGNTALHVAVHLDEKVLAFLLKNDASPNISNQEGETPLMIAVKDNNIPVAKILLSAGADLSIKNHHGQTAMVIAREHGFLLMEEVLSGKELLDIGRLYADWQHDLNAEAVKENYSAQLYLAENMLKAAKREFKTDSRQYAEALYAFAKVLQKNGQTSRALAINEQYLSMAELYLTESDLLDGLVFQGELLTSLGNYEEAINIVKTSLDYIPYWENILPVQQYFRLGNLHKSLGEDSMAIAFYKQARGSVSSEQGAPKWNMPEISNGFSGPQYMNEREINQLVINFIADCLIRNIRKNDALLYNLAETFYQQLLRTPAFDGKEEFLESSMGIQVELLLKLNDTLLARSKLQEYKMLHAPDILSRYDHLADIYRDMGDYDSATHYLDLYSAGMSSRYGESSTYSKDILYDRAKILIAQARIEEAKKVLYRLNALLQQDLFNEFAFLSESEKQKFLAQNKYYFDFIYSFALNHQGLFPELTGMVYDNALFLKGLLLRSAQAINFSAKDFEDPVWQSLYTEWEQIKQSISEQALLPASERQLDLDLLNEKAKSLEKALIQQAPMEENNYTVDDWQMVKSSLKDGEAAIEFVQFEHYKNTWSNNQIYGALVLSNKEDYPVFIKLNNADSFQNILVKNHQESDGSYISRLYVSSRGSSLAYVDQESIGDLLFDMIWRPLKNLVDHNKTLYVSLTGGLHKVALHSLPLSRDSLLIDRFDIHYVSSTGIINKAVNRELSSKTATVYGGILYDGDSTGVDWSGDTYSSMKTKRNLTTLGDGNQNEGWNYLPGTLREAESINQQLLSASWSTRLYTGHEAMEQTLEDKKGSSPAVLHMATHGFFYDGPDQKMNENENLNTFGFLDEKENAFQTAENPLLRSGLIMSGGNISWLQGKTLSGLEDGILTAYEIAELDLSGTDLVVLSACETGLGEIRGSEGLYGLQRAFKLAGANSLIMSLWQVPDQQTMELMHSFYFHWLSGDEKHLAFRKAQLELRKKYDPYFWAAFILLE